MKSRPDPAFFSPAERAAAKQRSRDEDARALASGQKSARQLEQENGLFSGMLLRPRLNSAKSVL